MPVRKAIPEKEGVCFLTFTCTRRLPLFKVCNAYDVLYNWFDHLKSAGHYLIGYVIMPHHVHALIAFRSNGRSVSTTLSNSKRLMAYDLIDRLEQQNRISILDKRSQALNTTDRKEGKKHAVFEPSFDWKECRTIKFIEQKLDYMHWNPCKAGLVKLPEEYLHSSALYYVSGGQGVYEVTGFMELEDIDLTGGVR